MVIINFVVFIIDKDDAIQPEDFTNQLQKELNSSPQPCLVPFLRVFILISIMFYHLIKLI
jgi:hypothetical protein